MRPSTDRSIRWLSVLMMLALACQGRPPGSAEPGDPFAGQRGRLPTGRRLDPAGSLHEIGQFPLTMVAAPGGRRVVLMLSGYRDQGVQVVDRSTGAVVQTLIQKAGFVGLAFSPDGRTLYASGGNQDLIYRYDWTDGTAKLRDSIVLAVKPDTSDGVRYPAGIGLSPDGRTLYAAENLADSVAVIDVATGEVTQRLPAGRYPYGVAVATDGTVYVSAWGASEVRSYRPEGTGWLRPARVIPVARHPSALLLNAGGTRLFAASGSTDRVTVVDTRIGRAITELRDPPPAGPSEGSTPNALALSADGTRLYVAEADNNAVAVFDLQGPTAGVTEAWGEDRLVGRIPAGWYPTALLASGDTLLVVNGKGRGAGPNPANGPGPGRPRAPGGYTLDQIGSTFMISTAARADTAALGLLSARVARTNQWDGERAGFRYPPIQHVIYVVKENRTYDQVLGDLRQGDGDTALTYFPRAVSSNHHALAERFGLFDRFFVNAEVSPDGHNWSMAAYTTDYLQKTVPSNYGDRGRSYDYEGTNRGERPAPGEDVAEPAGGYLWNLAQAQGLSFRNYGEFVMPDDANERGPTPRGYRGLKPFLEAHTDSLYPGYNLRISDQRRADEWIRTLREYVTRGEMPRLQIIRLPNDHTMGARAGELSARAYVADNDLALGRMIEALSRSPFWRNTVVFVLEDDAQNGPDHVDSHRSVLLTISAWNRPGVVHRWVNTTDVIATIEEILGLDRMSQFDFYGRALREIWSSTPDLTPYAALTPVQSLTERNPRAGGPGSEEAARLDFTFEDIADEALFNRSLWLALKGTAVPYPGIKRMPGQPHPR
ncbi:MAG TPA: bifunctional YncE family protein/alkaline phosphatase family protein [Gemmatimonadales bacterium]|nr:bifunctional YncE family protein/alkaline phosphatase family protein [Gemmatimonadales bacterium]